MNRSNLKMITGYVPRHITEVNQFTVHVSGVDVKPSDVDGLPYSTLLYGNGPGHSAEHRLVPMMNASDAETHNRLHSAAVPRQWATHGGEDVPVYAAGPPGITQALFSGTFDQSYVPHAIAYVACLAEHAKRCQLEAAGTNNYSTGANGFVAGKMGVLGTGLSSQVRIFFACRSPRFAGCTNVFNELS